MPPGSALLVRQARPIEDILLFTSVDLIAHSLVQTSRNSTAPVSRYSFLRQVVVAAAAGVNAAPVATVAGGSAAGRGAWATVAGGSAAGRCLCARLATGSSSLATLCGIDVGMGGLAMPARRPK